jgi:hypothetical protein
VTLVIFRNRDGKLEVSIFFPEEKITLSYAQEHCVHLDSQYVGMLRIQLSKSERLALMVLKSLSSYTADYQNCMQYVLEKILGKLANWMEKNIKGSTIH